MPSAHAARKRCRMHTATHPSILVLAALYVLPHAIQAQPACITEVDETDPFTKLRMLSVVPSQNTTGPNFRWCSVAGNSSLQITWVLPSTERIAVLEGDPLL